MDNLRQDKRYFLPQKPETPKNNSPASSVSHWAGLIRDHRYFSGLARAVDAVLDDPWVCSSSQTARCRRSTCPVCWPKITSLFHLSQAGTPPLPPGRGLPPKETFDERVKQDLLLALDVEIRFFNCLLEWLNPLIRPPTQYPRRKKTGCLCCLFRFPGF
ncbi:MAG: hypothetical protein HS126_37670 [Anaerolineales bacterium]|nr:hypothetical protein [Anaerolineales bacterium]